MAQFGPRKTLPMIVNTTAVIRQTVKIVVATRRSRANHSPTPRRLRSRYGRSTSAITNTVGTTTPPQNAEWLTNSCKPRKYHGALAGFGG